MTHCLVSIPDWFASNGGRIFRFSIIVTAICHIVAAISCMSKESIQGACDVVKELDTHTYVLK